MAINNNASDLWNRVSLCYEQVETYSESLAAASAADLPVLLSEAEQYSKNALSLISEINSSGLSEDQLISKAQNCLSGVDELKVYYSKNV